MKATNTNRCDLNYKETRSSKLINCLLTILDYCNIDRSNTRYYIHDIYVNDYILTAQAQF
jgi:hypothetical protein